MAGPYDQLSTEVLRDLYDAQMLRVGPPAIDVRRSRLFPDPTEFLEELRNGDMGEREFEHERSHLECALAVGAVGAVYAVEYRLFVGEESEHRVPNRAFVMMPTGVSVPRLAHAAIAAAPKDPSRGDEKIIRRLGYPGGVLQVAERIVRWNKAKKEPHIPLPGTL